MRTQLNNFMREQFFFANNVNEFTITFSEFGL